MNWHSRYIQQAQWTHDLRAYVFNKIGVNGSGRMLEVGCGTGAILSDLPKGPSLHGIDLDSVRLAECRGHVKSANLVRGNALNLPYADHSFDVVYCHFLLLWVSDPLQALLEMKRVTKAGGHVIAFAEPDYSGRIDKPAGLVALGKWQSASLLRQGANPSFGAQLAESFFQAGIKIVEAGTIQGAGGEASIADWELEWAVIESDLAGSVSGEDIQKMKQIDKAAREHAERVLYVPTYFVWGQIGEQ